MLGQQAALHLARRALGNRVHHVHTQRHLERGEALAAVSAQVVLAEGRSQHHCGADRLAVLGIGQRKGYGLDDDWRPLALGAVGEVCVRGPGVVDSYRANPAATAASFRDGWFRTGDSGSLSPDGYLSLAGRIKELINRGGEKISPREIDEVLLAHPAVAEAVCFGVPHATWGEEVAAAVVLRNAVTEADLLGYCREHLAEYKRPKQIHITETIPRTATGKIQRGVVARVYRPVS